jgi:hypothetical protein
LDSPSPAKGAHWQAKCQCDSERTKTVRWLAVEAHGRFWVRMAGPALARFIRFDASSAKHLYGVADSPIERRLGI